MAIEVAQQWGALFAELDRLNAGERAVTHKRMSDLFPGVFGWQYQPPQLGQQQEEGDSAMTASSESGRTYPPKQIVPDDKYLLVRLHKAPTQAKPFTKQVKNNDGTLREKQVVQANFCFRIADKRHPDLVGQYHVLQATDYVSADSKLFGLLVVLFGVDVATTFIGKRCFPKTWEDGRQTPEDELIPDGVWKRVVGRFYGAKFNPPKKDAASGQIRFDAQGSPFQTIKEVSTLDQLDWTEEQWKLWPPPTQASGGANASQFPPQPQNPKPAVGGLGPSSQAAAPGAQEQRPEAPSRQHVIERLRGYAANRDAFGAVMKAFLKKAGREAVGALDDAQLLHLLFLVQIREHAIAGGNRAALVESYLQERKVDLVDLPAADAAAILHECNLLNDDSDVPF